MQFGVDELTKHQTSKTTLLVWHINEHSKYLIPVLRLLSSFYLLLPMKARRGNRKTQEFDSVDPTLFRGSRPQQGPQLRRLSARSRPPTSPLLPSVDDWSANFDAPRGVIITRRTTAVHNDKSSPGRRTTPQRGSGVNSCPDLRLCDEAHLSSKIVRIQMRGTTKLHHSPDE
ncbi:hypothetical protein OPV22_026033 [Ensete ventricosum]|uniref:Uncharacterized protein n=1 Tax=Ensete ventricosum TaxID=4639 RepID=A0AAV8P8N4_ENSVE|nr:hypothetical protein OPV22_026033 [Ensete ventricosum]